MSGTLTMIAQWFLNASCTAGTSLGMANELRELGQMKHLGEDKNVFSLPADILDGENFSLMWLFSVVTAAIFVSKIVEWFFAKARYVQMIEKLPGPSLDKPNDAFKPHKWMVHLSAFVDTTNPVPGYPGMAKGYENFSKLQKQFQKEGLFRIWAFHPFKIPFARSVVILTDQGLVRQLLTHKRVTQRIQKAQRIYQMSEALVGDSYLTLENTHRWKHQRKLTALGMHQKLLERANDIALKLLYEKVFPQWDAEATMNGDANTTTVSKEATKWCTCVVAEILGIIAFSRSFGGLEQDDDNKQESFFDIYQKLQHLITRKSQRPPFLQPFYWKEKHIFSRCEKELKSVIQTIVQERIANRQLEANTATATEEAAAGNPQRGRSSDQVRSNGDPFDLLDYLMMEEDTDKELKQTEKELLGNVRMFLFAGQDTTATTLSFALYELACHPCAQKKLQEEVDGLFASDPKPAYKDLLPLEYLDAVIKEVLRLHAPGGVARETVDRPITLAQGETKYVIPARTTIYTFPSLTGLSVGDDFAPERFLTKNGKQDSSFMPFSVGPRNCVGQPLAMSELKVILAHMVRRYNVQKTPGNEDPIKVVLLTIKAHRIMLDFEKRSL